MNLSQIVETNHRHLKIPAGSDLQTAPVLLAVADVESGDRDRDSGLVVPGSGGLRNLPVHEGAYDFGGRYWKRASHVRDIVEKYGAMGACSWSSWQILYVTAWEMGFRGAPIDLWDDLTAARYVVKLLNARIFGRGAKTIEDVGDGWNTGSPNDSIENLDYEKNVRIAYDWHVARLG